MSEHNMLTGTVAIVGRPNVGKSTLLNHILEQKISITSRKPQTTRNNVMGIKTLPNAQMVFVDTPGIHLGQDKAINRFMNKSANSALVDVDAIVFVVDKHVWTEEDEHVLHQIQQVKSPVIIVINKVDQIEKTETLLPHVESIAAKLPRAEIIPISALKGKNLDLLEKRIIELLPKGPQLFPEDQVTDKSSRFLASEIVREKITRQLGAELPYQMAVEIEKYEQEGPILTIYALILVEREGQKRILIGDKGEKLKTIGSDARKDMELLFDSKVMLKLWVKVKSGWSDDERALKSLGYHDQ